MRCSYLNTRTDPRLRLAPINMSTLHYKRQSLEGVDALLVAAEMANSSRAPPTVINVPSFPRRQSYGITRRNRGNWPPGQPGQPGRGRSPRPPRPVYTPEQDVSLLYFRDIVELPWKKVESALGRLYDRNEERVWPVRSESGLQSRYYRLINMTSKMRKQLKREGRYISVLQSQPARYWWMFASNFSDYENLARVYGEDSPEMLRAMENLQNALRRGARRSSSVSDDGHDTDMMSDAGAESNTSASVTRRSCSPMGRNSSHSPSPTPSFTSADIFAYKAASPAEQDDDTRSLIDHSMDGLDDGSRRHSFRAISAKL